MTLHLHHATSTGVLSDALAELHAVLPSPALPVEPASAGLGQEVADRGVAVVGRVDAPAGEDHGVRHEAVPGVAQAHQHLHPRGRAAPEDEAGGIARPGVEGLLRRRRGAGQRRVIVRQG